MKKEPLDRRDWIAGLEKGLAILEAFDHDHPRLTPTQAAELTGLTRTAARRYLLTLEHLGYLTSEGTLFSLTPRVLKVGWSYFDSARLPRTVQPFLQQVQELKFNWIIKPPWWFIVWRPSKCGKNAIL